MPREKITRCELCRKEAIGYYGNFRALCEFHRNELGYCSCGNKKTNCTVDCNCDDCIRLYDEPAYVEQPPNA